MLTQSAGTVVVRMPERVVKSGGGVTVKGKVRVRVWRVVVKVSVTVVRQECFVRVVVEVVIVVVVVGARREEQAVERVGRGQVVRAVGVGVAGRLRLLMGREGPLFEGGVGELELVILWMGLVWGLEERRKECTLGRGRLKSIVFL